MHIDANQARSFMMWTPISTLHKSASRLAPCRKQHAVCISRTLISPKIVTYAPLPRYTEGMAEHNIPVADELTEPSKYAEVVEPLNAIENNEFLTGEELVRALHSVFDEQIINYGAYNLVYATGRAIYRNPDLAVHQSQDQQYFIIGYQESPDEVIIAPVNMPALTPAGTATTIDNTNALHAYRVGDRAVTIESVNGSSFLLSFDDDAEVATRCGTGLLEQGKDVADFCEFVTRIWPVL